MKHKIVIRSHDEDMEVAQPSADGTVSAYDAELRIPVSEEMLKSVSVGDSVDIKIAGKVTGAKTKEPDGYGSNCITIMMDEVEMGGEKNEFTELAEDD